MKAPLFSILSILSLLAHSAISFAQDTPAPVASPHPGTPEMKVEKDLPNSDFLQRSNEIVAKIRDNERRIDPFGLPMDPTNAVDTLAMSDEYEEAQESPSLNASSFKTALQDLPISGMYPSKQTVVIGARSFNRGDQFGMKLEELTIRLRVEGIKGTSIFFRDMDTQEVATVEFNPKPSEFEPIIRGSKQPMGKGIVPMSDLFIVN